MYCWFGCLLVVLFLIDMMMPKIGSDPKQYLLKSMMPPLIQGGRVILVISSVHYSPVLPLAPKSTSSCAVEGFVTLKCRNALGNLIMM